MARPLLRWGGSSRVVGPLAPRRSPGCSPSPIDAPVPSCAASLDRWTAGPHGEPVAVPLAVPLAVDEAVRHRLGIVTTADLAASGVGESEVRTAVRQGTLVRLRAGVFVTSADLAEVERSGRRPGLEALAVTTSLGRPSAVLSGATAAWIWGLPRPRSIPPTVGLTDPHRWRRGRGWLMTRAELPDDEVTVRGAYRVTSAARTVVDLARAWPEVDAVATIDAALLRGLTTPRELAGVLGRQAFVPGIPRAVRAVGLADGRAESWLETYGRLAFAALALPPFVPQVELWVQGRLLKVVDGWYERAAVAIEFDGQVKYSSPQYRRTPQEELWNKKRTEDLLRSLGIRFIRVAAADLRSPRHELVPTVHRLLATSGPAERAFREVPRARGRFRSGATGDDGWLPRADDRVGRGIADAG